MLASGAIGANGHGNISLRVAGGDEMYFTSAPSLHGLTAESIARVRLDGTLIEGQLPPIQGAVVDMHASRYRASDEIQCVLHTHSPFATAFAVAQRPIECCTLSAAVVARALGERPSGVVFAVANHAGASWRAGAGAFALRHRQADHATYRQASVSRLAKKT